MNLPKGKFDPKGQIVVKEYEAMLEAYGKAGGNLDALNLKEVGNLVIHKIKSSALTKPKG
jgi:hypothetical protein